MPPVMSSGLSPRDARRKRRVLGVLLAGAMAAAGCHQKPDPPAPVQSPGPGRSVAEIRELDIAFFRERAQRDPTGAMDLAHLAALYLARGRETGDPHDAVLAERTARRSLRNRAAHNQAASAVLQSALLAQHRFREALALATAARDEDPESNDLRAGVAEIQMELGLYDEARMTFQSIRPRANELSLLPRLARWAEITGDTGRARRLLRTALGAARAQPTLPAEQLAWYHLRVGDLELRLGDPVAADSAYTAGLAAHPGDHRLLSALAHSALAQRRWRDARRFGEEAIAIALDPTTLGILSDAAEALGDTAAAVDYARVLDIAVLDQPEAYHRAWSLFLLDHGRHLDRVAKKIRAELATRKDVYAYDLHAWSLHLQGRDREALAASRRALQQGTQDALLFHHAGAIMLASGDTAGARAQFARALAINPFMSPRQESSMRPLMGAAVALPAEVRR